MTAYTDGAVKLDLGKIKVGYDSRNPQYAAHEPPPFFDYADPLIYRANGDNCQRIFFDEVRFADSPEDASAPWSAGAAAASPARRATSFVPVSKGCTIIHAIPG